MINGLARIRNLLQLNLGGYRMQAAECVVEEGEFVILGVTTDGSSFKLSGWSETLCHSLGRAGSDGHVMYPSYVHPVMVGGVECVVVCASLRKENTAAFDLIKRFIAEHRLMTRAGRGAVAKSSELIVERRNFENNKWQETLK